MNHKWSLLGVGRFYTREEALTLLMNMSDFEDESTSESEIEGDSSDSSVYAPRTTISGQNQFNYSCCFTPKVSKSKEIPKKGQKAAPKLVVNQNATKHALLADETATKSGEEHVASPPKVSKAKEISEKGQKAEPNWLLEKG